MFIEKKQKHSLSLFYCLFGLEYCFRIFRNKVKCCEDNYLVWDCTFVLYVYCVLIGRYGWGTPDEAGRQEVQGGETREARNERAREKSPELSGR